VAAQVEAWMRDAGIQRLVLGGDEEAVAGFRDVLPASVTGRVVGTLGLPFFESEAQTLERVRPLAEAYEREREAERVEEGVTAALKGGRGALGLSQVLSDLQQGRVMTVLAAFPVSGQAWECTGCGLALDHDAGACPVCGQPLAERPLESLLPLLAFRTAADIELVRGEAAERLAEYGGLAAELRF
jgi:hypothetical protein